MTIVTNWWFLAALRKIRPQIFEEENLSKFELAVGFTQALRPQHRGLRPVTFEGDLHRPVGCERRVASHRE